MSEAGKMDNKISTFEEKIEKLDRIIDILRENGVLSGDVSLWKMEEKKRECERQLKAVQCMDESKMEPRKLSKHFELHIGEDATLSVVPTPEAHDIIYRYAISSYSGMYEWVQDMANDVYSFLTGNHDNNYSLGSTTLKDLFKATTEAYLKEPSEKTFNDLIEQADVIEEYYQNNVVGKEVAKLMDRYVLTLIFLGEGQ